MANIEADVTLPSGEEITVTVDESWTDAQIQSALVASGDIQREVPDDVPAALPEQEPAPYEGGAVERGAYGFLNTKPLIGVAGDLIEQYGAQEDDVTTETKVWRQEGVPEDVPVFHDDPGAMLVDQTFTQPGRTKEDIRKDQELRLDTAMATNFPELHADKEAVLDSTAAQVGQGVKYLTDLITMPVPAKAAAELMHVAKTTKVLSTPVGRAALGKAAVEGAKVGGVFAGADDGLRQLASTGEIDAQQLGTAALLGGVGGAVLAPVLSANVGKVLGHFGKKLDDGADPGSVTADELREMAPEMSEDQIANLLSGFDEAAFAAKYEPKVQIELDTSVSSAKAERSSKREVYAANKEVARAKAQKARTDLAVKAEETSTRMSNGPMVELKRNMNAPRHKRDSKYFWERDFREGDLKAGFKVLNGAIERLEHIAAGFSPIVRRVGQQTNQRTHDDMTMAREFYHHKDMNRMSKADRRALEIAMTDSDGPRIREITNKWGEDGDLTAKYERVRAKINEVGTAKRARDPSIGFVSGHHPRAIKSVRKARAKMGRKDRDALDEALRASVEKKGRPLDAFETEAVVRQYLRKGGNDKLTGRRIETVGDEYIDLYESTEDALMGYLHRHHEEVATREFFQDGLKMDMEGYKDGAPVNPERLSKAMTEAMLNGDIPQKDITEAADLIKSIFGPGRQAMNDTLGLAKSIATVGVIGNPISTTTQVQDLAQLIDQFGLLPTFRNLFGSKIEDVYSVGLKSVAQDMKTNHGIRKVLSGFMKASGFQKMDHIMANTGVNASLRTNFKLAKNNPSKAVKKMEDLGFAPQRARQLVEDLKARRVTDDVRTLNVVENGKIRPVGIEDMPKWLVDHPNGRLLATLLTWTMKQANRLRNGAYADIRGGHPIRGTRKALSLLTLMGATGTGVGALKDFMRGEELNPYGDFVQNMFALGMSGKIGMERLMNRGGEGFFTALSPFFGIWQNILGGVAGAIEEGDPMQAARGFGSFKNYEKILREGPLLDMGMDVLEQGAGALGAAYDSFFANGEQAIELPANNPQRVHKGAAGGDLMPPRSEGNGVTHNVIKGWENSVKDGWNKGTGLWMPHESIEKGNDTLAYGHKLTNREVLSGKVRIDGKLVSIKDGLTEAQADALFQQDHARARQQVLDTVSVPLAPHEMVALTSLMFNIGPGKAGCEGICWHNSAARRHLNAGNREKFMYEAYDPVVGFVKSNGEVNDGLVIRRANERRVFMGR